ncbi:hypothetical protein SESBI_15145 [Sesbania bispinosa]|nr:hypothetical protein SESBI_15145 [Sesbania bispinosa]
MDAAAKRSLHTNGEACRGTLVPTNEKPCKRHCQRTEKLQHAGCAANGRCCKRREENGRRSSRKEKLTEIMRENAREKSSGRV